MPRSCANSIAISARPDGPSRTIADEGFMILADPQRVIDHLFSRLSATMVLDDAPMQTGAKSKPRQLTLKHLGSET